MRFLDHAGVLGKLCSAMLCGIAQYYFTSAKIEKNVFYHDQVLR